MFRAFRVCLPFLLAGAVFVSAGAAKATLIGDTVRVQMSSIDSTFVVANGGPELSVSSFHWDVEAASISFYFGPAFGFTLGAGLSFTVSELDWVGFPNHVLSNATITSATNGFSGANDSMLSFDDHSVTMDLTSFAGVNLDGVPGINIALESIERGVPQIPEPSALLVFGMGLAGLLAVRRRQPAPPTIT